MVFNSNKRAYKCINTPKERKPVEDAVKQKTTAATIRPMKMPMATRISANPARIVAATPKLDEKQ